MDPARYPRRDIPDIALLFGEERNEEVAELNPGDWVEFEASMVAHGHRGDPEVMVLWHIKTVKSAEAVEAAAPSEAPTEAPSEAPRESPTEPSSEGGQPGSEA